MPEQGPRIAVVTDSTASLSDGVAAASGIVVVPLQVVIGATSYDEHEVTSEMVAEALRGFTPVSTSRPTPTPMGELYADLAAQGFEAIVSVHLSAEMSGTHESALLAARTATVPVEVVDSRQVGPATGHAALAAVDVAHSGGSLGEAAEAARDVAARCTSLLYVDTLEYLRRGGRVGAAAALIGGALAVKPLLQIADGVVAPLEKVRTAGKALARLEELAARAADDLTEPAITVAHLASEDRARLLADKLEGRLDVPSVRVAEVGAVLGAHVGPGMVSVCVAPGRD